MSRSTRPILRSANADVILTVYPLDWTFVCPTEILAFNSHLPDFAALNTKVLAISTDSAYSHLAWSNTKVEDGGLGPGLKLSLVADKSMKISRDYGVLLEVSSELGGGIRRLTSELGAQDEGVALRGLFIVDPKGILRQMSVNGIAVGRSVDETLRLVKALQFVSPPLSSRALESADDNEDGRTWRSVSRKLGPEQGGQEDDHEGGSQGQARVVRGRGCQRGSWD